MTTAELEKPKTKRQPKPFRPSHLAEMAKEEAERKGVKVESIDTHKLLRDLGFDNPLRKVRVTGSYFVGEGKDKKRIDFDPVDCEAVDEGDAIAQARAKWTADGIKYGISAIFHAEVLEE
jgi:hypothetical protein